MSPEQRARVAPTLFIAAGVLFASSSAQGGGAWWSLLFGVGVGVVVAAYGVVRLLAVRREQRRRSLDEDPPDP